MKDNINLNNNDNSFSNIETFEALSKNWHIHKFVDQFIEQAQIEDLPLEETLKRILPELIRELECEAIFIKTYDEELNMKTFKALKKNYKRIPADFKKIEEYSRKGEVYIDYQEGTTISIRIDVSGVYFGYFGAYLDKELTDQDTNNKVFELNTSIEIIDNYLSMIRNSAKKQRAIKEIGEALSDKLLNRGLDTAINKFYSNVEFDKLIFLYWHDLKLVGKKVIKYVFYDKNERITDSEVINDQDIDDIVKSMSEDDITGEETRFPAKLLEKLDISKYLEKALIYGKNKSQLVGKVIISKKDKKFNTTQRDILSNFVTLVRQRIVDFNKEYKNLSSSFPVKVVNKLLSEDDYIEKYISPKEQLVAVMYCDIASFTKISEQILKEPTAIADFINDWSHRCVDIVWDNGGVFDKMVGDCVIALFGPPFYEYDAKNLCIRAIKSAIEINRVTEELSKENKYKSIRESELVPGLGVATGINYCPMFIGRFGPNKNFTGFSKGMNNTSRLQGLASFRDIFITQSVKDTLGKGVSGFTIGEMRQEKVKNVKNSLTFYPIKYHI